MKIISLLALAAVGLCAVAVQGWAHHSTAGYDFAKTKTLTGVVTDFQWTNPHSYIQIEVPDGKGGKEEWSVEAGTPATMTRMGWTKNALKRGDNITVVIAPPKDKDHFTAVLLSMTLPDGKVLNSIRGENKAN